MEKVWGSFSDHVEDDAEEDEQLIFALDSLEGKVPEEDEDERETTYLGLAGFELEGSSLDEDGLESLDETIFIPNEAVTRKASSESQLGASPVLLSVLEQVAAEARVSVSEGQA